MVDEKTGMFARPTSRRLLLICIDWQVGFKSKRYWGTDRSTPDAEEKGLELLTWWRGRQLPIIHIVHSSTDPNSPLHPGRK